MTRHPKDYYISVDVEAAGPNPADYALLSIGACTLAEPVRDFYIELRPAHEQTMPQAMRVNRLSMEKLMADGTPPQEAMQRFADWLKQVTPPGHEPVFVAYNAPFDWMFINDYFHHYLGHNPFGYQALDIKAFAMAITRTPWQSSHLTDLTRRYFGDRQFTHHALRDARDQADIFRQLLAEAGGPT